MSENIKFGILIPTYYRQDGSTFEHLSSALKSVLNQTYENWVVVLIGDDYENEEEWEELVKIIPREKIVSVNLPHSLEREFYQKQVVDDDGEIIIPTPEILWFVAGSSACNYGLQILKDIKINYYCHLDHDDTWYENHLQTLRFTYSMFPEAGFIYTQGRYGMYKVPNEANKVNFKLDNLMPTPGSLVHSATSCDLNKYKLSFPKFNGKCFDVMGYDFYPKEFKNPHDAFRWMKFPSYVAKHWLHWVYVPDVTVYKNEESLDKLESGQYIKLIE